MAEEDKDKNCFTIRRGTFGYKRMPLGLTKALENLQHALDIIFTRARWHTSMVYLDDEIVYWPNDVQNVLELDRILGLLDEAGDIFKMQNLGMFSRKEDYLGDTILPGKLTAVTEPRKEIDETPFPDGKIKLRSVRGALNVYRWLLWKYTGIERPPNAMLKKDAEVYSSKLNDEQFKDFLELLINLGNPQILGWTKIVCCNMVDTKSKNMI